MSLLATLALFLALFALGLVLIRHGVLILRERDAVRKIPRGYRGPIRGGATQPVYVWPLPTGFGRIGGFIVFIVALLVLLGVPVPHAEWWCVLGFGIWLAF